MRSYPASRTAGRPTAQPPDRPTVAHRPQYHDCRRHHRVRTTCKNRAIDIAARPVHLGWPLVPDPSGVTLRLPNEWTNRSRQHAGRNPASTARWPRWTEWVRPGRPRRRCSGRGGGPHAGDHAGAVAVPEDAAARLPHLLGVRVALSHAHIAADSPPEALERAFRGVLALDPHNEQAKRDLEVLYRKTGRWLEGVRDPTEAGTEVGPLEQRQTRGRYFPAIEPVSGPRRGGVAGPVRDGQRCPNAGLTDRVLDRTRRPAPFRPSAVRAHAVSAPTRR